MDTHADKEKSNNGKAPVISFENNEKIGFSSQFAVDGPGSVNQRYLQQAANNSPRVKQTQVFQAMADNYVKGIGQRGTDTQLMPQGDDPESSYKNETGLPDGLKESIENNSGYSLDDVKVHYNSPKPAQLQALAYTQGADIHLGAGQEKHLPHEAWHVVQQKQGRVKATGKLNGQPVNNEQGLENEASRMGAQTSQVVQKSAIKNTSIATTYPVIQRYGDKMAVGYEDLSQMSLTIRQLQDGIRNIYDQQKLHKAQARHQLDVDYTNQSANLEEKQDYLILALEDEMLRLLSLDVPVGIDFSAQRVTLQPKKLANTLLPLVKGQLDLQAAGLAPGLIVQIKAKIEERRLQGKSTNKAAWRSKVSEYARDFGRHHIADGIVHGYEQGYKASAMNKRQLILDWTQYCDQRNFDLTVATEDNVGKVSVISRADVEEKEIHIATVYFDEKRFQKVSEVVINKDTPQEERREIFAHRETGEQYVQDAFGAFVRRHVRRALNKYDNPATGEGVSIKSDPRIKTGTMPQRTWSQIAAEVPAMSEGEKYQEIRNHQRAKELQNGSPFISFTTTSHPIFGSSAKLFEEDEGVATVDLAQISKNKVFDTHTSEAIKKIHDVDDPNPTMPFREGDERVERNSAARDAMRTRELVVSGDIPNHAITGVKAKGIDYVKGPSGKFQHPTKALEAYMALLQSIPLAGGVGSPKIDDVD